MSDPRPSMASTMHPHHPSSMSFPRPGAADVASFDSSFNSPYAPAAYSNPYAALPPQDPATLPGSSFRGSFHDSSNHQPPPTGPPQIYTAVYSGVMVYEMEVDKIAVMRRRADSWLNATQILKVAQIEKGRRTKILEKEILTGQHEKVQGGYGRYQGTWISYARGRQFCREYGVEDLLLPLLDYDLSSDGTGNSAFADTPTKEQAQAANRRKMFNTSIDSRINGGSKNTFFQNISPTASNALAAMNKAARYDSPLPRPGSAQKRPSGLNHRHSSSQLIQDSNNQPATNHHQSFASDHASFDASHDGKVLFYNPVDHFGDINEPPRKKPRTSFAPDPYLDPVLQEETPTEPNESFINSQQQHYPRESDQGVLSVPPLPTPDDKVGEDKRTTLLDLFAEPTRQDFQSHAAIQQLSGQDLDIPIDTKGNTALHWAGMLGKVTVIKALVAKGANIYRGNAGGEHALMLAVQVNNTHQQNNFPEMLEYLGPLIELRDAAGKTILHHIAVASGIKGRTQSSRYYLESLLAFTVRQGGIGGSAPNSQSNSFVDKASSQKPAASKPMNLARFMSEIVNIQDKCGNTALNLVSRIGSHSIIKQLEEVGADFGIANHKGFRPESFGIFPKDHNQNQANSQGQSSQGTQASGGGSESKGNSQIDQIREEIFATTQSILAHTTATYTTALTKLTDTLTAQSTSLRALEAERSTLDSQLSDLKAAAAARAARTLRKQNLQNALALLRDSQICASSSPGALKRKREELLLAPNVLESGGKVPDTQRLRSLLYAHNTQNTALARKLEAVKSLAQNRRVEEQEVLCRKVVALCTGTREEDVDGVLDQLVAVVQ